MESHQEENRNLLPTNVMEVAPLRRSLHAKIAIAVMASLSVIAIFVFATTDTTGVMPYATNLLSGINIFNTWRDGYHNHGTPGINGNCLRHNFFERSLCTLMGGTGTHVRGRPGNNGGPE